MEETQCYLKKKEQRNCDHYRRGTLLISMPRQSYVNIFEKQIRQKVVQSMEGAQ